jgi:hypothetical protein
MSAKKSPGRLVGRRHWIVMVLSAMAGCGGGADGTASGDVAIPGSGGGGNTTGAGSGSGSGAGANDPGATTASPATGDTQVAGAPGTGGTGGPHGADPGTGGTGIFSHGSISAFGSVVLNGIHFDETGAQIRIDGAGSGRAALRLGMVAGVQGERYADGITGRADSIEVWSIARGVVTASRAGQFTVLGMTVQTQGSTFWEGVGSSGPGVGQWVAVWGLQADASASVWVATRVAVVSASSRVVATGMVAGSGDKLTLNGIALSGDDAKKLHKGRVTRIEGKWEAGDSRIEVQSHHELDVRGENVSPSTLVEIEGVVTALLGGNRFTLGSVTVDASALSSDYAKLKIGQKLEVYGTWQGQVLKATEFELEDD